MRYFVDRAVYVAPSRVMGLDNLLPTASREPVAFARGIAADLGEEPGEPGRDRTYDLLIKSFEFTYFLLFINFPQQSIFTSFLHKFLICCARTREDRCSEFLPPCNLAVMITPAVDAAEWNLDGKWQIVSASPTLPETRGHKGTIRISAYELQGIPETDEGVQDEQYDIGISGACNAMGGGMIIAAGRPEFHSLKKTAQICPDERGAYDKAFHGAVTGADRVTFNRSHLVLESTKTRLVLEPADQDSPIA